MKSTNSALSNGDRIIRASYQDMGTMRRSTNLSFDSPAFSNQYKFNMNNINKLDAEQIASNPKTPPIVNQHPVGKPTLSPSFLEKMKSCQEKCQILEKQMRITENEIKILKSHKQDINKIINNSDSTLSQPIIPQSQPNRSISVTKRTSLPITQTLPSSPPYIIPSKPSSLPSTEIQLQSKRSISTPKIISTRISSQTVKSPIIQTNTTINNNTQPIKTQKSIPIQDTPLIYNNSYLNTNIASPPPPPKQSTILSLSSNRLLPYDKPLLSTTTQPPLPTLNDKNEDYNNIIIERLRNELKILNNEKNTLTESLKKQNNQLINDNKELSNQNSKLIRNYKIIENEMNKLKNEKSTSINSNEIEELHIKYLQLQEQYNKSEIEKQTISLHSKILERKLTEYQSNNNTNISPLKFANLSISLKDIPNIISALTSSKSLLDILNPNAINPIQISSIKHTLHVSIQSIIYLKSIIDNNNNNKIDIVNTSNDSFSTSPIDTSVLPSSNNNSELLNEYNQYKQKTQAEIDNYTTKVQLLESLVNKQKQDIKDNLEKYQTIIDELERKCENLHKENEEYIQSSIEKSIIFVDNNNNNNNTDIHTIQQHEQQLSDSITQVKHLEEVQSSLNKLKNKIIEKDNKIKSYEKEVELKNNQIKEKNDLIVKLQCELQSINITPTPHSDYEEEKEKEEEKKLKENNIKIKEYEEEIINKEKEISDLKLEIEKIENEKKKEINQLQNECNKLNDKISDKIVEIEEKDKIIKSLEYQMNQLQINNQTKIAELTQSLSTKDYNINNLKSELETIKKENDEIISSSNNNNIFKERLLSKQSENDKLRKEIENLNNNSITKIEYEEYKKQQNENINELQNNIKIKDNELSEIKSKYNNLNKIVEQKDEVIENKNKEMKTIKETSEKIKNDYEKDKLIITSKLEEYKQIEMSLNDKIKNNENTIKQLTHNIHQKEIEMKSIASNMDLINKDKEQRIILLESEMERINKENNINIEKIVDENTKNLNEKDNLIKNLQSELNILKTSLENSPNKDEVRKIKIEMKKQKDLLDQLKEQNNQYKLKLQTLTSEKNDLTSKYENEKKNVQFYKNNQNTLKSQQANQVQEITKKYENEKNEIIKKYENEKSILINEKNDIEKEKQKLLDQLQQSENNKQKGNTEEVEQLKQTQEKEKQIQQQQLQQTIDKYKHQIDELSTVIISQESNISELKIQISQLKKDNIELVKSIDLLHQQNNTKKKEEEEEIRKAKSLSIATDIAEENYSTQFKPPKSPLQSPNARKSFTFELKTKNESLTQQITKLEGKNMIINKRIKLLEDENKKLKLATETLMNEKDEESMKIIDSHNIDLMNQMDKLEIENQDYQQKIIEKEDMYNNIKGDYDSLVMDIENLKSINQQLENEIENYKKELIEKDKAVDDINMQLQHYLDEINMLKKECQDNNNTISNLSQELHSTNRLGMSELENDYNVLFDAYTDLRQRFENFLNGNK